MNCDLGAAAFAGAREFVQGIEPDGRVFQAGAGRPSATDLAPGLVDALRKLAEPQTRRPGPSAVVDREVTGNLAGELGTGGSRSARTRQAGC